MQITKNRNFILVAIPLLYTKEFLKNKNQVPRIIIADNTASFVEPALFFGKVYSGSMRPYYDKLLKDKYANSYFYNFDQNRFFDWSLNFFPFEFASMYEKFYVYFFKNDSLKEKIVLDNFRRLNINENIIKINLVYFNSKTKEAIYELTSDTSKAKLTFKPINDIFCNVETVTKNNYFISNRENFEFANGKMQSNEFSHSGKYSLKLTKIEQYGMDITITSKPDHIYDISVWRHGIGYNGVIVASSIGSSNFYESGSSIIRGNHTDWEQICLKFTLPVNFPDTIFKVYLWNNGNSDVFFDDFKIQEFEKLKR